MQRGKPLIASLLLLVLFLSHITHGFNSSSNARQPTQQRTTTTTTYNGVPLVRAAVSLLEDRYGSGPEYDWRKVRSYLYQTNKEQLSLMKIEKVLTFLDDNLSPTLGALVVQQSPRILQRSVETNLKPTVDFLLSLYGPDMLQDAVQRNSDLLLTTNIGYQGDALDLVAQLLKEELSMTQQQIERLKRLHPSIFQSSATQLLSAIGFFREQLLLSSPDNAEESPVVTQQSDSQTTKRIAKLLLSHPPLFLLSVEDNLRPRMEYLRNVVGSKALIQQCLHRPSNAGILALSIDTNLQRTVEFLQSRQADVARHPAILGLSLENNLIPKVEYLDAIDCTLTERILAKAPVVFSLSLQDNLIPKLHFLRTAVWDDEARCVKEICVYPSILTLSLERNIRPTVQFYTDVCGVPPPQLQGRHIAASLYRRLLPRFYFARKQKKTNESEQGVVLSPHILAIASDIEYCRVIGQSLEDYNDFRNNEGASLRFQTQWKAWLKYGTPIDLEGG